MKERLLQYIWQFQYYSRSGLTTTNNEPLQVIYSGQLNTNQGPDFSEAKLNINGTFWAGNIEVHIHSSDWNLHHHSNDKNYNNIILHVVWIHDVEIKDINGNTFPTLELQSRVSKLLLTKYEDLMNTFRFIPCENQVPVISELNLFNWKQRLLIERLEKKSSIVLNFLQETNFNWEEAFWWLISRNFGIKVNSEAFEKIAKSISINILSKHKNQIHQLEALLFGQAGLLTEKFNEEYPEMLQKEYIFLSKKYKLQACNAKLFFLRMRPANFPTIRLAQLAMLIHDSEHLFSKIKDADALKDIIKLLKISANDYWHYHYVFDELSGYKIKVLGSQMITNILINTIVPMLFAYGHFHKEQKYKNKAIGWMLDINSEKNSITKGFESLDFQNKNALDSQAFIQLKNEYCNYKRCLDCTIGNTILKSEKNLA